MEIKEKINKLMERDDLEEEDISFLEECQLALDSLDSLTSGEDERLDKLYDKHFINFKRAKKENKSMGDYF